MPRYSLYQSIYNLKGTTMGIILEGYNTPVIGRVGNSVGYLWKGRACLRTYCRHINYPNTEGQQRQRNWFVGMVRFASAATEALRLGLRQQADEAQMTEGNYFILKNKQHFRINDGQLEVDYNQLRIATGSAADIYFHNPKFEENETISVTFEKNMMSFRASGDDRVYLYVYAPGRGEGYLSAPATRRCKSLKISLPEQWAGEEVHLYGFVVDKEGRASNSTYIGPGRVNHYEERGRYVPLNKNWKDFVDIATEANAETTPIANEAGATQVEKPEINLFRDPPKVP